MILLIAQFSIKVNNILLDARVSVAFFVLLAQMSVRLNANIRSATIPALMIATLARSLANSLIANM